MPPQKSRVLQKPRFEPDGCGPGDWVLRRQYKAKKRITVGFYGCGRCRKGWLSAWAQKHYGQQCKRCKQMLLPLWLWQNDPNAQKRTDRRKVKPNRKPHLKSFCEACMHGRCKDDPSRQPSRATSSQHSYDSFSQRSQEEFSQISYDSSYQQAQQRLSQQEYDGIVDNQQNVKYISWPKKSNRPKSAEKTKDQSKIYHTLHTLKSTKNLNQKPKNKVSKRNYETQSVKPKQKIRYREKLQGEESYESLFQKPKEKILYRAKYENLRTTRN